ncbi:dynein light chain Tctex-type protein 2B-like [Ciona intestinalis]|uniref:Tctex1 domain-containing protein 2-like n=1 Tax=Ciona intestinalis TaxID=7719 RepID=F6THA9_CIOIN|nr:tctex1 domain-containing protein 2-like [Ciona intestinalis]|eukprot:XP_002128994.1 tctex1 domain-containing protein 2-like [Ciona intestinalis]
MASTEEETKPENTYMIRPNFQHKFKKATVKECIHQVVSEHLSGKQYNSEEVSEWTQVISNGIKTKLKEMGFDRYKFVVQCVIGEQRGEGVKMGCRCFWDSDTDNYAQDVFMNSTLFCVTAAFGVFYY